MKNIKSNPAKTMLTITVGFILIYIATKWNWAILISLIIGLAGIVSDYLSKKINFLWMKLVSLLSLIVPNIILAVIFYLFLFPISVLSRLFGKKDPLHLKNNSNTVFTDNKKDFNKASFEKPW